MTCYRGKQNGGKEAIRCSGSDLHGLYQKVLLIYFHRFTIALYPSPGRGYRGLLQHIDENV
jgi:hypothetical protein